MSLLKVILSLTFLSFGAMAKPSFYRWTLAEDKSAEFNHVLEVLNAKSGAQLSSSDFLIVEDRDLANNHFRMYVQIVAGVMVKSTSLRLWTDLKTNELIQAEASVEGPAAVEKMLALRPLSTMSALNNASVQQKIFDQVKMAIEHTGQDTEFRELKTEDVFENGQLIRLFKAKAKHGTHIVKVQLSNKKVISAEYEEFPQGDLDNAADEFSIPALVYPMYEQVGPHIQERVIAQLKYLKKQVANSNDDPYVTLKDRHYYDRFQDSYLGLTAEGQAQGYWSMTDIKQKALMLLSNQPKIDNSFAAGKVILEGRYATINIHKDAITAFPGINFTPERSSILQPDWAATTLNGQKVYEMIPDRGYLGKPLQSFEEAFSRPARRLPDHNPAQYLSDGFDEIQVYYAINTLFDSLHSMGFSDPELSTRPFHAYLYDPAIGYRNNAYYTDDTINFTTYTPTADNYARDNPTIWHELGHGVMDRLMGDFLHLADTGGLSEGMADFVAALVVDHTTNGLAFEGWKDFRINNSMGFHLSNEVHDDGEAYGGAMKDIMTAAIAKFGRDGASKVGDLTLEAMRLCRNHPYLTAEEWFNHVLFADELGHAPIRQPGELKELILSKLGNRNFVFGQQKSAGFKIIYNNNSIESGSPGSRNRPIPVSLAADETATYPMQIKIEDGDVFKFQYPVTVRVRYRGGALQGSMHWIGEENGDYTDYLVKSADEALNIELKMTGTCDYTNQTVGCQDYAYIQVLQNGSDQPIAKKRFYLRLTPKQKAN